MGDGTAYRLWRFLVRYVSPMAVALVLLKPWACSPLGLG
jgi:hypothetical protein